MSQPNDYPPGVPCWVDTLQPDPDAAVRFYGGLDFRVPDTDAAVGKAKELGGKVVAPPFDIPRFRQAVLADPQGAVFSVSSLRR